MALPRGCFEETLESWITRVEVDERICGSPARKSTTAFLGGLRHDQRSAFDALSRHELRCSGGHDRLRQDRGRRGTGRPPTNQHFGAGHRKELLKQWVERLQQFLSVDTGDVGTIGGGRRKPTGRIEVALIQSLVRKAEVSDQIAGYGHLIVDECHHLSAFSFEMVARRSKAGYVLGLSLQ